VRTPTLVFFALAVALLPVAPAAASGGERSLRVQVGDWDVVPSRGAVPPGPLRLTVENLGRLAHELEIVPTTTFGGRRLGHAAAPPVVVGAGETRSVRVTLMPGFYLLVESAGRAAVPILVPA